jgi:hypothetical protein
MNKKFIPCGTDENLAGGHWVGQDDTVDQIAVNLVREGINKHRARALAVHFIRLVKRDMSPKPENDDMKQDSVVGVDEMSGWASVENPSEYLDDLRGGADE